MLREFPGPGLVGRMDGPVAFAVLVLVLRQQPDQPVVGRKIQRQNLFAERLLGRCNAAA